jgi:hypothetical protein
LPLLALLIVGFIFPSRRVQGAVAVASAVLLVFGLGYFRLMAGAG